nr:diphosphomevalonate decarboxylase [Nocardia transvalensis]
METAGEAVTAVAHPNIALVKYWGKRDEDTALPVTDSVSMTLDIYPTTTTVRIDESAGRDVVTVAGAPATGDFERRVVKFLELVRATAGRSEKAAVDTINTVPTGAGLASSASGFAALATAAAHAYGLDYDRTALSRLARRGSGSASRSIFGGFVAWYAGTGFGAEGDRTSFAEPVASALDPAMVVAVVDAGAKSVSSRTAMRHTVDTSPLYRAWAESSAGDFRGMLGALAAGNLDEVGEIAEHNALGMHATMLAARPAVRYLSPATLTVLDRVRLLREDGVPAYATIDAGPNVKVLCHRRDARTVAAALTALDCTRSVVTARPGPQARLVSSEVPA